VRDEFGSSLTWVLKRTLPTTLEISGQYEGGSTLASNAGHPIRIQNGRSANLWYGSLLQNPINAKRLQSFDFSDRGSRPSGICVEPRCKENGLSFFLFALPSLSRQ
jgi:hypothetical protein